MKLKKILKESNSNIIFEIGKKHFLSNLDKVEFSKGMIGKFFDKKGDYRKGTIVKKDKYLGDVWFYKNKPVMGTYRSIATDFVEIIYLTDKDAKNEKLPDEEYEKSDSWFFNFLIKNKIGQ